MNRGHLPEQTVRRAGLDLPISITRRRSCRRLWLAGRSLDQCRSSTTLFRRSSRGCSGHHLDAGAFPRRVQRLLKQRQDQSDVLAHRVLQGGHLSRQLIYSRVYLFYRPAWSALKVTWNSSFIRFGKPCGFVSVDSSETSILIFAVVRLDSLSRTSHRTRDKETQIDAMFHPPWDCGCCGGDGVV